MTTEKHWLTCLWCKNVYNAITLNVVIAMLGAILFFLADAQIGNYVAYSIVKGLASIVFLYGLASAIILKKIGSERYYSR